MRDLVWFCLAVVVFAIGACASAAVPVQFSTMLDSADGLGPGDPVTHAGAMVGHVTTVSRAADGSTDVGVQIDSGAKYIHDDSVLLLNNAGASPSLEVTNTDPTASSAVPGSYIAGASNEAQVQMLLAARGAPALAGQYQQAFGNTAPSSPLAQQNVNDLMALWQATVAATAGASAMAGVARTLPGTPPSVQIVQMQRDEYAVEQQLRRQGRWQDADRLHNQMTQFAAGLNAGARPYAPPSAPSTYPAPASTP